MTNFTLNTTVQTPYAATVERVRGLLGDAGFGVLTEIDVQATMRTKLGVEIPPQVILGACRPELAHRALQADSRLATLLPCNVVVAADGDTTKVEVFDPNLMTDFSNAPELADIAQDARQRITGMLTALAKEVEATGATPA
jgi:uncharacterized protein (DUF302 family)